MGGDEDAVPQWQGIVGNAAVVVGGRKRDAAQKGCGMGGDEDAVPQWHRTAGFAAVAVGAEGEMPAEGRDRRALATRG